MLRRLAVVVWVTCVGVVQAADNTPPEGFVALFNGKDLTGWKGAVPFNERAKLSPEAFAAKQKIADEKIVGHWTVKEGVLHYDGKGVSLAAVNDYADAEFLIDWKIEKAGDSGLYLRGQPQVQIWDSENLKPNLKSDANTGSGGLWNNAPGSKGKTPLKKADKPVGEWNTFHIIMKGDLVTVKLNGELVVDAAPLANYWDKGKPLPKSGPFELQHHGDHLEFKNIYVKELK